MTLNATLGGFTGSTSQVTYSWEYSTDGGKTWLVSTSGAGQSSKSFTATAATTARQWRVSVKAPDGRTARSAAYTIKVG